jgi:GDP-4-dehydro-6-deoxy-D-mannose reductase
VNVALVTGSHGFVGSHLRAELRARGWSVAGLGRADRSADPGERYVRADLRSMEQVAGALDAVQPDVIFHLAASPAFKAGGDVTTLVGDAVAGTFSLCSALVAAGQRPRVVLAGSSAQYGFLPLAENPISEDSRTAPANAYGFAKAAAEDTARAFAAAGAFELIPVRAFNHVGPGEPPTTVASAFARRIADVLAGRADVVTAADLDSVRDFTDVRDIAAGYADLAERGTPGRVYNLCSGRPATVGDVLDGLLAAAGLDRSVVRAAPAAASPAGSGSISYQVGSPRRIQAEVGWQAERALPDSLRDLLALVQQDVAL